MRVLTYFGRDNGLDGIVLDVLLGSPQGDPRLARNLCPRPRRFQRRDRGDPRGPRPPWGTRDLWEPDSQAAIRPRGRS